MPATKRVLYMRSWMIGLVLGTVLAARLPWLPSWEVFLCFGLVLLCARHRGGRLLAGALAGCALVGLQGQQLLESRLPDPCTGGRFVVEGVVASLPRVSRVDALRRRQRFEFDIHHLASANCSGPRKVLLSWYGEADILPGQRWRFDVRLRRPWGLANEGSFNIQSWYTQTAIDAVGSAREADAKLLGSEEGQWLNRQRHVISSSVAGAGLSETSAAVLRAVTVADKSGIDHHLWGYFQRFGINHLLVISGLHIGMVAGLGYLLGRGFNRLAQMVGLPAGRWPEAVALVLALAYTGLAGFSVATQRALYMLMCFLLARAMGRNSGGGQKLLIAAVLVLILSPLASLGSGFWLSFSAVAALLWLAQWGGTMPKWKATAVAHLYMGLLMLPLGGFWFGGGSWLSAPANLLMVPLVGLCVVPLALAGAVLSSAGSPHAVQLWQLAAFPLDSLFGLVAGTETTQGLLPLQAGHIVLAIAVLGLALLALPGRNWQKMLATVLWLPLLLPPSFAAREPLLTVLDVGQGTAVLFQSGEQALLYDTAGGNPAGANLAQSVVLPFLRNRRITRLDSLVVSHGDQDHSAGLETVLGGLPVDRVWLGGGQAPNGRGETCRAGQAWRWKSGARFQFLSPGSTRGLSDNDGSCVLLIETGQHRILLAGDVEERQERELVSYWQHDLASDLLLVAHHGSKTSTSQSWLNRVEPGIAVINNGYGNRFGHPAPVVLERLGQTGVEVRHTAREGALEFRPALRGKWWVTGQREGIKPWWM